VLFRSDQITFKLTGEGLTHYSPIFDGTVTFDRNGAPGSQCPLALKVFKQGGLLFWAIDTSTMAAGVASSLTGTVPPAIRPSVDGCFIGFTALPDAHPVHFYVEASGNFTISLAAADAAFGTFGVGAYTFAPVVGVLRQ
jgi:hypothetical protein